MLPRELGRPETPTRRERFDRIVVDVVAAVDAGWRERLAPAGIDVHLVVDYAVEDTPMVPDNWTPETVPLSSLVRATERHPHRIVLFRRPVEHRCESREEVAELVHVLVVEQVAELLGLPPEDVNPDYEPQD